MADGNGGGGGHTCAGVAGIPCDGPAYAQLLLPVATQEISGWVWSKQWTWLCERCFNVAWMMYDPFHGPLRYRR